ncbi:cardiolipin synthase A [Salipiger pallidus]|uniref:Cardiolipin synthase n=1 Tax=Salipiger pallidus TaxID=1775170 RepID=A0A8J2ZIF4_9RHOB|nr:cardiolipin synthase [Salipiger pallidus]GGG66910.1 cardiolipin synthase A [Salipiger pallidus]
MSQDLHVLWSVAIAILLPLGVAVAIWRVVTNARTPQGSVAWVVFLLAAPWFALPAYLFFGHHKLHGFKKRRRISHKVMKTFGSYARTVEPATPLPVHKAFARLAEMPVTGGNGFRLLVNGDETFPTIFDAIDRAEDYVLVQYYTVVDDDTGRGLADRLMAAAERGVEVRMLYDGVGSYGLSSAYRDRLLKAGVRILDPGSTAGPTSRLQINFRNHRKTVIIDGKLGFTGGLNMSDTYRGLGETFDHWRDTHVELTGPAVAQLQLAYVEDWHWATDEALGAKLFWMPEPVENGADAVVVPSGPVDELDSGALFYCTAINAARSRVWIATPYFVPDGEVMASLQSAALRGCDVRVLLPEGRDHWLTWLAAFSHFPEARRTGVQIWRYQPGFMHQKVILVDDDFVGIGTANLDNRSFRLNFETMVAVFDSRFAEKVEHMLELDFTRSRLLETDLPDEPLLLRGGAAVSRLLAPIL